MTEAEIRTELEHTRLMLLRASARIHTAQRDYAGLFRKACELENSLRTLEVLEACKG